MDDVFDLSPLLSEPTRAEVSAWRAAARAADHPWSRIRVVPLVGIVGVVALSLAFLIAFLITYVDTLPTERADIATASVVVLVVGALTVGTVALFARTAIRPWRRWYRLSRFAAANDLEYLPEAVRPAIPGTLFQSGAHGRVLDRLRPGNGRLDMGNYRATFGSGRSRHVRTWAYAAVRLRRRLPHMLLDARANEGLLRPSSLPSAFRRDQVLSLEGDFDRHFTLYCPREYERDALYVFTPDLMAVLIDEAATFDVEIIDDWMVIWTRGALPFDSPATIARFERIIGTVAATTVTRARRYSDARATTRGTIAPMGARLRPGIALGTVLAIVAIAAYWLLAVGIPLLLESG